MGVVDEFQALPRARKVWAIAGFALLAVAFAVVVYFGSSPPPKLTSAHKGWDAMTCTGRGCHDAKAKSHYGRDPKKCPSCHGPNS
ncbi:MAG: hypothetical protein WC971_06765 [Coriobacteriia bacterium]